MGLVGVDFQLLDPFVSLDPLFFHFVLEILTDLKVAHNALFLCFLTSLILKDLFDENLVNVFEVQIVHFISIGLYLVVVLQLVQNVLLLEDKPLLFVDKV